MNYASEDLINEHEGILYGLHILEKMIEMIKNQVNISIDELKEMVNFFKLFADKCHHGKEETMLFPEMEKAGIPKENGPIEQMLYEHTEGRKYIAIMDKDLQEGTISDAFTEAALQYINLLRSHINKENNILFPMGDRRIAMDTQKHLLQAFEKYEDDVMGKGTHEKFHDLLHNLGGKYLQE
ncbi:MAG TPA: hemerythrin domain-containing protein [Spirochaetota bacterium]|nr:hemerythrin domain-containing protein [Spirochaetota bacterium]